MTAERGEENGSRTKRMDEENGSSPAQRIVLWIQSCVKDSFMDPVLR